MCKFPSETRYVWGEFFNLYQTNSYINSICGNRIAYILFWDSTFTARMTGTLVYEKKKKKKSIVYGGLFMVSAMSSLKITTLAIDASYLV